MTDDQKNALLGAAAVEGVTYAILVYLAATFTAWPIDFRPSVGNGEMIAIGSTIRPLVAIFLFALVHRVLQGALCKHGPKQTGWAYAIDLASSIAPAIALAIALLVDWIGAPAGGYYAWALWYLFFIALIVGESVYVDILALRRY